MPVAVRAVLTVELLWDIIPWKSATHPTSEFSDPHDPDPAEVR
jgi:hypothetical protein